MENKKYILFLLLCTACLNLWAQDIRISGTVTDGIEPIIGANIAEKDGNDRIVSATVTDINGNFSMVVKNTHDKLTFSYVGMKTYTTNIGNKTSFNVTLQDATTIKEVVVTAKNRYNSGGLSIPEREVSVAKQTLDMKEFEGLSFTSVDEAMQGKIAGLDIVMNTGNLGSSTTMRLRGVTTITGDANPLIVVDGNIMDVPGAETTDFTTATEDTYASLLSINPSDIESIDVLKDAAATAVWGSRGANGVISIKTKRGARGKLRVDYNFRLQGTWQPKGYNMLNGDDYTMLMKEEFYNPSQSSDATTNINELNYNRSWSEYENWNNNTDWVDAVEQVGWNQTHYVTVSGGGEKANFRVSGGFDHQNGTIIKQELDRFSTRLALDYYVSERIKFSTTFPLTYTSNKKNNGDILSAAQKMAPNMSIYRQDSEGNDTDEFYIMLPSGNSTQSGYSSERLSSIRSLGNPVAIANLAWNNENTYRISPEFRIEYRLLGADEAKTRLDYSGSVYLDVFSKSNPTFYPGALSTNGWSDGNYNKSTETDYSSMGFTTRHRLTFTPHFKNDDWYSTMMAQFEMRRNTSNSQSITTLKLPNGITSTSTDGDMTSMTTSDGESRGMSLLYSGHLSYKERYIADFSLRADGTTKFGANNKWGYFPGVSVRWNMIDESWMKPVREVVSMLAPRASWGVVGNQPGSEYLQYSKYATGGVYGSGTGNMAVTYVDGMQLTGLQWERTSSYNIGANVGFLHDVINVDFNYYYKQTDNLLMKGVTIPNYTGYESLGWKNVGKMENKGWELNIEAKRFLKIGKFSMSANFNISQNFNKILEMDQSVLDNINSSWSATTRGQYYNRIQLDNPLASIYGLKYKGVYQYSYDWLLNQQTQNGWTNSELVNYLNNDFLPSGKTAPVAIDNNGHVLVGDNGLPLRMQYNYSNGGQTYSFDGGDAIYEDVNHDGQINSLDIMYLGNSNPKFSGGFGVNLYYGQLSVKASFNYRTGYKVVNLARMNLENMYNAYNQSSAVNWRWRKNGDVTDIPRALYNTGYNWLGSDRFVEDGSFLRFNYLQIAYNFTPKQLKKVGLNRLQVSLSGQNLFVWSHYSGTDPEHPASGWGYASDDSQTPRSRSFTLSINVGI